MSSSDTLQRPILRNLSESTPPRRQNNFVRVDTFDEVGLRTPQQVSPEDAYQNGLAEGEARGREAARLQLEPAIQEFKTMALTIAEARASVIEAAKAELIEIAGSLARSLLRGELIQNDAIVLRMARACIDAAKEDGSVIGLHVAPADAELVRTHVPELEVDLTEGAIRVLPDASLSPGEVIIETERACYEGRPERLLEATLRTDAT